MIKSIKNVPRRTFSHSCLFQFYPMFHVEHYDFLFIRQINFIFIFFSCDIDNIFNDKIARHISTCLKCSTWNIMTFWKKAPSGRLLFYLNFLIVHKKVCIDCSTWNIFFNPIFSWWWSITNVPRRTFPKIYTTRFSMFHVEHFTDKRIGVE